MKDKEGCLGIVILFVLLIVAFFAGAWIRGDAIRKNYEAGALERGYAEWSTPENPRAKPVWQWIEPEGE